MLLFADGSSAMPRGGIGVVVVCRDEDRIRVTVEGKPLPDGAKITNQRAEIAAIAAAAEKAKTRSILWTDSTYAAGVVQPHISGWRPKANMDVVKPAVGVVKQALLTAIVHVTGHVDRKHDLPPMFFHDLADRAAGKAAVTGDETAETAFNSRAHIDCLTCVFFPCRGTANHDEPCDKKLNWPHRIVERFTPPIVAAHL